MLCDSIEFPFIPLHSLYFAISFLFFILSMHLWLINCISFPSLLLYYALHSHRSSRGGYWGGLLHCLNIIHMQRQRRKMNPQSSPSLDRSTTTYPFSTSYSYSSSSSTASSSSAYGHLIPRISSFRLTWTKHTHSILYQAHITWTTTTSLLLPFLGKGVFFSAPGPFNGHRYIIN